ncbi:hypothetical protein T492DRAFT_978152 [Pavlovales sp. CCMP2436]|nr:hypothetical protein T492DRAFT_978152 [Pavlovales sp. CCMP2436]
MIGYLAIIGLGVYLAILANLLGTISFPEACKRNAQCFLPEIPEYLFLDTLPLAIPLFEAFNVTVPLPIPPAVRQDNGTLWVHLLVFPASHQVGYLVSEVPYNCFQIPLRRNTLGNVTGTAKLLKPLWTSDRIYRT